MAAAFRIFFYLIVTSLSVLLVYCYIVASGNNKDLYQESLERLKSTIDSLVDELVPFDIHEFKILTWKIDLLKPAKEVQKGYLSTIFQERLFAFVFSEKDGNKILHISSDKDSYTFHTEESSTKVFLSDVLIGTIERDNIFTSLDGNYTYDFDRSSDETVTISKGGEELAEVYIGKGDNPVSDRYFKFIHNQEVLDDKNFIAVVIFVILLKK